MALLSTRGTARRTLACPSARLATMILASFAASTSSALAEEVQAISPPVASGSTDVAYPAEGKGDAAVVLELVVEKDGAVSDAKVIEGAEPFAEHARRAVLGWQFVLALRGTQPV